MEASCMISTLRFLENAKIDQKDERFERLFSNVLSRIPPDVSPVTSVRRVSLREVGRLPGLVGLTRWSGGRQTITFYSLLLGALSDEAYSAIIAHELAHAWLNEHEKPEESATREREADDLAGRWGFGEELSELAKEADSIGGSVY
jgi:hypothetical protein